MIISHKYKFIFIKTRKTAGTSIEIYLSNVCDENDTITPITPPKQAHKPRNYEGFFNPVPEILNFNFGRKVKTIKQFIKRKKFYNHIPAKIIRYRVPYRIWSNYYKFCFDRNPWDKTVSHYFYKKNYHHKNKKLSWEEYFKNGDFCLNYPLYTDKKENIIVDKIAKFENLNSELISIFDKLNIPFNGNLNIKSKTKYRKIKNYKNIFADKQREIINKVFKYEIKLFNYKY